MGGTHPKAALLLLCSSFSRSWRALSEPPGEPDRAESATRRGGRLAGRAGDPGVSDEAPRRPTIEGARLQTGEEGEKIIVVVGHEAFFPDCFLMEARATRGRGRGAFTVAGPRAAGRKRVRLRRPKWANPTSSSSTRIPHPGAKAAGSQEDAPRGVCAWRRSRSAR